MNYKGTLWTNKDEVIMLCINTFAEGWLTLMQMTPPDPTQSKIHIHISGMSRYYERYV